MTVCEYSSWEAFFFFFFFIVLCWCPLTFFVCIRSPRCLHFRLSRTLACGSGGSWAHVWSRGIPQTSEHHLDMVPSSCFLLLSQTNTLALSGCQQACDNYMFINLTVILCVAKLFLTWHRNVTQNRNKLPPACTHTQATHLWRTKRRTWK